MAAKKTLPVRKAVVVRKGSKAKELSSLEEVIGKVPVIFKDLAETEPDMYQKIMRLEHYVWGDGALTRQTKKLIAIAIAAALRDPHAVRAQLAGAPKLGVTREEIEEALRVTFLLSGMPAYVYGKAAMEEVLPK
ncbi:MAG: carboxymuconolactone decarboxylase family protein [Methanomicrobiales archaeon]|nr:carboxymuconolactone decarboxylase family protein [Methanomicrobiales archaeon]